MTRYTNDSSAAVTEYPNSERSYQFISVPFIIMFIREKIKKRRREIKKKREKEKRSNQILGGFYGEKSSGW